MTKIFCLECRSSNTVEVNTYKRIWHLCLACGCGSPVQKKSYPLAFLPLQGFRKPKNQDQQSIYDYFVDPGHIEYSIRTAGDFLHQYAEPQGIQLESKRILDVSGGNGYFLKEIEKRGASVALTEINKRSIDLAREKHGYDVYEFDFNVNRIDEAVPGQFDIIMLRAAIMFCRDLGSLATDLSRMIPPGGLAIVNHSVIPTLGVLLRVQLDEFSYAVLRQPETVVAHFQNAGFKLNYRYDETDPSLYVYDHDLLNSWMFARTIFEIPAARKLRSHRNYTFAARDRRRSTMIFERLV